ncbi:hypothetical protein VNO77_34411 [Canavalia gladiata]|uniref:Transmembrane protein n=1 Tax=Canavalia gladiata TaxID=3824 RepID=A0AAN9KGN8_CANGL
MAAHAKTILFSTGFHPFGRVCSRADYPPPQSIIGSARGVLALHRNKDHHTKADRGAPRQSRLVRLALVGLVTTSVLLWLGAIINQFECRL